MKYLNFDLLIDLTDEGYRVRVDSPHGEIAREVARATLQSQGEALQQRLDQSAYAGREAVEVARAFGGALYDLLFDREAQSLLDQTLLGARQQGMGMRLRLRWDAPEIAQLPWEYLYRRPLDHFLALSPETPLVRYLHLPKQAQRLEITPPLRVLVALASPQDQVALKVEQEWHHLQAALQGLQQRGLLEVEQVIPATLPALQQKLQSSSPFHIFHFIGHGAFDTHEQKGWLLFEDEGGQSEAVSGERLGTLLGGHPVRLAFLNACGGGQGSLSALFAGVAQGLVQHEIPAVLAMQGNISDTAALTFSRGFYEDLASNAPVDEAMASARRAIFADNEGIEWGIPVLYLRAPDGQLFDLQSISREAQTTALWHKAQAALAQDAWAEAIDLLSVLLKEEPEHPEGKAALQKARQQLEMVDLYEKGQAFYEAERWREALDCFNQVQQLGGNYKRVFALIATVKQMIAGREEVRRPSAPRPSPQQFRPLVRALAEGQLIPFLGGEANLCGRPPGVSWQPGQYLPTGKELATRLEEHFGYPPSELDLGWVTQQVSVMEGVGSLYDLLAELYGAEYPPTPLHQLLASIPALLRQKGYPRVADPRRPRFPIFISANYDDVLERAFETAGEAYHLISYVADEESDHHGQFLHRPPDDSVRPVESPNDYKGLLGNSSPVILKLAGARVTYEPGSVVITENQYIEYPTRREIINLLPVPLPAYLKLSGFLFLGYHLRNWYRRLLLHRLIGPEGRHYKSWVVHADLSPVEEKLWQHYDVDIFQVALEDFVAAVSEELSALQPARRGMEGGL